jgi:shikimate kinase
MADVSQNWHSPAQPDITRLSKRLKGTNLYLIGMMGSGKSTVGQILAQQLGYRFFDTDALIEQAADQTVSQIFAELGEDGFRQLETQVLGELAAYTKLAIATGGGIILKQTNWSYLHHGITIWLDVPVDLLYARLQGDTTRPLLQQADLRQKLQQIFDQRQFLYRQADVRITIGAGETPEQVAFRVLTEISQVIRSD